MARNYFRSKDKKNSKFYIIVYFFLDAKKKDTYTKVFFSKYEGQAEAKGSFLYWREKIHIYRLNSEFGINCGCIYNNLNPEQKKKPILKINGDGSEIWSVEATIGIPAV